MRRYGEGGFWDAVSHVFFLLILVLSITAVLIAAVAPRDVDGASMVFGYELRLVESNSMQEHPDTDVSSYKIGSFKKNSIIALELVPEDNTEALAWYSTVAVGDVLTVRYTYDRQVTITHRVTSIEPNADGTGYIIGLQGDNLNSDAGQLTQQIDTADTQSTDYVIGRVVWTSHIIGLCVGGMQRVAKTFFGEE